MRDHERRRFESWGALRHDAELTIAALDVPYYVDKIRQRLPRARLHAVPTINAAFASASAGAAVLMPAERGSAWTLRYPQFAVVVPLPDPIRVPLAYALPPGELDLAAFVNTWIDLKRQDGTIDALYEYWILGRTEETRAPRWSIVRDVLHWVK